MIKLNSNPNYNRKYHKNKLNENLVLVIQDLSFSNKEKVSRIEFN